MRLTCTKFDFRSDSSPADPARGAYSALPDPLPVFKGVTCKGAKKWGKEGKEEGNGMV